MTAPPADPQGTKWTEEQREAARDIADTLDPWKPWSWSNMEPMLPMLAKHAHLFTERRAPAETPALDTCLALLSMPDNDLVRDARAELRALKGQQP